MGPFVSLGVAFAWAHGDQRLGGLLLVAAGAADLIDGTMARRGERTTRFGGFLDAVADRYSDLAVGAGLRLFFARLSSPGTAASAWPSPPFVSRGRSFPPTCARAPRP